MQLSFSQFRNPGLVPWLFIVFATVLLLTLGTWQVKRMFWKEAVLEQVQMGQELPPETNLPLDAQQLNALNYRRVQLMGEVNRSIYFLRIGMHRDYGNGYFVLSPMQIPVRGATEPFYILVNRGFISGDQEKVRTALASEGLQNPSMVEGILRPPYAPRLFSPENHPEKNIWSSEDLVQIRQELMQMLAVKSLNLMPFVLESTHEEAATGMPAPHANSGEIRLKNDHLGYAITWYSLALVGVIMFVFYCRKPD